MSTPRELLLAVLEGDEHLLERLRVEGLLPGDDDALTEFHLERARVVYTLVHELEVNWAGVEVIVRMREELVATRTQVVDLVALLRQARRS